MAAGAFVFYNDFIAALLKKTEDMDSDTFKLFLVTSSSNAINKALVGATYGAVTNELSTANGYTAGGAAMGGPTIAGGGATATITWDTGDVSWTASGGTIVARAAVVRNVTTGNLVGYFLLDSTPANVTTADGTTLTINIANILSMA